MFHTNFELHSTAQDAVFDKNPYQYCEFIDSAEWAFGSCGPTGAISNNAIGKEGSLKLQTYTFSVFVITKLDKATCSSVSLSLSRVVDGASMASWSFSSTVDGVSFDSDTGQLTATSETNSNIKLTLKSSPFLSKTSN